jgi:hypothetical protein
MKPITGIVRDGQIIPQGQVDWPNGTKVDISLQQESLERFGIDESQWRDDPAALADWQAWIKTIEPLEFTPAEQAEMDRFKQAMRQYNVEAVRRDFKPPDLSRRG